MGFTVTPLAQKARTATLIADSDLNLGNYDLIATGVEGDTAKFDEFIGGVGNFSNVLGSGNLDIEGTGNIKGLTTFQNAVQVNGALHVEGSINNVNIADNGEITTAQGVNGADFNGAKITSTKFNGATIDTSGNVTGASGTFSGKINAANISSRNSWVLLLSDTAPNYAKYSVYNNILGSINAGQYGSVKLDINTGIINAGSSISRVLCYNPNSDNFGLMPIVDIKVMSGKWSYNAVTSEPNITMTFNNKTITSSGVSLTLSELKNMLITPFNSTIKNNGTNNIYSYDMQVRFNNTSSNQQYGYLVPLDLII